jgi:CBS domain-containing protein
MNATLVGDIMTTDVVTLPSSASFREIVTLMLTRDIGAVPVVDEPGHLIGIVSRTDLVAKEAIAQDARSEAWELLTSRGRKMRAQGMADTAGGLMTTDPVTVTAGSCVARAAYLMQRREVTHLPVLDENGILVGVVSRTDLLKLFLRGDAEVREAVIREVLIDGLDVAPDTIEVTVQDGIVTLSGTLKYSTDVGSAIRMTRAVSGVIDVVDELRWRSDD